MPRFDWLKLFKKKNILSFSRKFGFTEILGDFCALHQIEIQLHLPFWSGFNIFLNIYRLEIY